MPLQAPELDVRTYEEIKRLALLRIPRYTPEWTDFNESDPGVTLVELFAWLTDQMRYQMNRIPERNYLKFLQLLGLELQAAEPARAHLTFTPTPGEAAGSIPRRAQIQATPPGGDPLIFETETGLDLIRVPLSKLQVFDGAGFTDFTADNTTPGAGFGPFGLTPQVGSALYLGFGFPESFSKEAPKPRFPQQMRFRVFLPLAETAGEPLVCQGAEMHPELPVTLVWEYRQQGPTPRWRRLNTFADTSAAFTREGYITVEGPNHDDHIKTVEGLVTEPLFWLRVRISAGSYAAGRAPKIDFLRPNVVQAENLSTVRNEPLGVSDASPGQTFTLRHTPVYPETLELEVEELDQPPQLWEPRSDFLASTPDNNHYTLNLVSGEIRFGDGQRGRIPTASAAIRVRLYRYGGGKAGNVGPDLINTPLTNVVGLDAVTNERPARGGRDEQPLDDLKQQAPAILRCAGRAVSAEDFAAIAKQVGGIAKVTALPLFHPDYPPDIKVPGVVTVVVMPDTLDTPPKPSPDELEAVCAYLDSRRLLTTELIVKGPEYLAIRVEARVAAQPYAAFGEVERRVVEALNAYLDPLGSASRLRPAQMSDQQNGQSKIISGSDFGLDLYPTNLFSVIRTVKDVRAVLNLAVYVDGLPHDDLDKPIRVPPDGLVYGAPDHDITVEPYVDR